jgi:hypothetical protein
MPGDGGAGGLVELVEPAVDGVEEPLLARVDRDRAHGCNTQLYTRQRR